MTKIGNVHDAYFKASMTDLRIARDFLRQHLPADILAVTNLSTLKLQKETYVSDHLRQMMSDVLYQATIRGKQGYIYLLVEHQSTPDRIMPFRLLHYMCEIMARDMKASGQEVLPVVVPLVFYHGKGSYPHSTDIFELFGDSKQLAKKVLLEPFHLIDVGQIPDEELKKHGYAGVLELVQKHIYARNLSRRLYGIVQLLKSLETRGMNHYIISTLEYVINVGDVACAEELVKLSSQQLSPQLGEKVMTLAEKWIEKGKAETTRQIAAKMLAKGADAVFVSSVTGLSLEVLKSLVA